MIAGCLVPPVRVGLTPASLPGRMWLPIFGWRRTTKTLSRRVQRAFGVPMLLIGLLILPVLVTEFAFADVMRDKVGVATGVDVATRLIWLAFALEFTVLLAVTPRQIEYVKTHWVDLVIILLPFLAFLRSLQLIRVGQLMKAQKLSKLAATYRLRGLAVKVLQSILVLRVLENISAGLAKRRIDKVRENIHRRVEEIAELQEEMVVLRQELAVRLKKKRAKRRLRRQRRLAKVDDKVAAREAVSEAVNDEAPVGAETV